jgi:hypothetical protein
MYNVQRRRYMSIVYGIRRCPVVARGRSRPLSFHTCCYVSVPMKTTGWLWRRGCVDVTCVLESSGCRIARNNRSLSLSVSLKMSYNRSRTSVGNGGLFSGIDATTGSGCGVDAYVLGMRTGTRLSNLDGKDRWSIDWLSELLCVNGAILRSSGRKNASSEELFISISLRAVTSSYSSGFRFVDTLVDACFDFLHALNLLQQ